MRAIPLESRLESQHLRDIWCVSSPIASYILKSFSPVNFLFCIGRNECDPDCTGSLDRDAFARGMVQLDEELRKAQLLGRASAGWNAAGAARALRPVPSRPILH